jgi:hypothetical protein
MHPARMTRSLASHLMGLIVCSSLGATELPRNPDDVDSYDIEPPVLIPNRDREKPGEHAGQTSATTPDLEKLAKNFERAKRSAAGAERLCRIGVIAQVEVEQRALRAARLESQLEEARMAEAKANFAREQERVARREISKSDLAEAEAMLAHAIESAHNAEQNRQQAELAFAENNVRRQQKLVALGSGRKSDVARAEQKLAELKAPKEDN